MEDLYFRKLNVYTNSKELVKYIYSLIQKFPPEEKFALCTQIRRASTSIPINIAEGFGRFSSKEKARFIEIAFGSLTEISCELELSYELGYITLDEFDEAERQIVIISKQLSNLHKSVTNNFIKTNIQQTT
ncbi:MAG: four helix bundle protein [Prevotella sp.]|nr:four helix bundle protein [Prevotella sp.]